MLVKSSGLLAKIQETYPSATQDQIDEVLAGGDEPEVLNKASKLQRVLELVGAMQAPIENASAGGLAVASATPIVPAKKKGGRVAKTQTLANVSETATRVNASTATLLAVQSEESISNARNTVGAVEDIEQALSSHVAGRILGMEASIASKVAAIVAEAGDSHKVDMGGIMRRSVDAALDNFFAEMGADNA